MLDLDFYWGVFGIGILTRSVSSLKFWTRVPPDPVAHCLNESLLCTVIGVHLQNPLPRAGETQGFLILLFIHFLFVELSHKPDTQGNTKSALFRFKKYFLSKWLNMCSLFILSGRISVSCQHRDPAPTPCLHSLTGSRGHQARARPVRLQ